MYIAAAYIVSDQMQVITLKLTPTSLFPHSKAWTSINNFTNFVSDAGIQIELLSCL